MERQRARRFSGAVCHDGWRMAYLAGHYAAFLCDELYDRWEMWEPSHLAGLERVAWRKGWTHYWRGE